MCLCVCCTQLLTVGDEVLVFFNDAGPFQQFVEMMRSERDRADPDGLLLYHTSLVELLAYITEGKNVYTEIKCHSLLPLDDIVKVVTHPDCIPEVRQLISFPTYDDYSFKCSHIGASSHLSIVPPLLLDHDFTIVCQYPSFVLV